MVAIQCDKYNGNKKTKGAWGQEEGTHLEWGAGKGVPENEVLKPCLQERAETSQGGGVLRADSTALEKAHKYDPPAVLEKF